jgi:hypothetical protein
LREQLGFLAALQAVHIMAVAMVGSSVLMIDLRLLGLAERSQTLAEVAQRFVPWLWGGLVVLTLTAIPLIIAEPQRDLTPAKDGNGCARRRHNDQFRALVALYKP